MKTLFDNMQNMGSKTIHRVPSGDAWTACGLPLKGAKRIATGVTCQRCKDTNEYKYGGNQR